MTSTPEQPLNRDSDPAFVRMVLERRAEAVQAILEEPTDYRLKRAEHERLQHAARLAINPYDSEAHDSWSAAQRAYVEIQQTIEGEDG